MMMKQFQTNSYLFGSNAPFIEELYESYLDNPASVSEQWRDYFDALQIMPGAAAHDVAHAPVIASFAELAKLGKTGLAPGAVADKRQIGVLQMISAYRFLGNRWACTARRRRTLRSWRTLPGHRQRHRACSALSASRGSGQLYSRANRPRK